MSLIVEVAAQEHVFLRPEQEGEGVHFRENEVWPTETLIPYAFRPHMEIPRKY